MAKICFITLGDIEKVPTAKRATGLASELTRLGHRISIVAWDVPANRIRLAMECPEVEPLWVSNRITQEIVEKIKLIRRWQPELIYQTSFMFRNLAGLREIYAGHAKIVSEHCELYSAFDYLWYRLDLKWLEKRSVVEVDGLVCASHYLKNEFDRYIASIRGHTQTIYLPYAYPFYLTGTQKNTTDSAYKRVLLMTALWKNYGVLDVIQAAKLLAEQRQDFIIEIVGNGPAWKEAKNMIETLKLKDRVFLKGFVPEIELNQMFSQASVFLAPLYKTVQDIARCPSKVYYYLPYQKPIVTCAFGDPYDLLKEDGFYYEPADIQSMACIVGRALDVSDRYRYKVVQIEKHSWAHRAKQFEHWCEENGWLP